MESTEIAYIYVLKDPRSNIIRYVGKTIEPKTREKSHIYECRNPKTKHKRAFWIRKLLSNGETPIFEIIKVCPLNEFEKWESEYIKLYKSDYLTNSDDTGQGNGNRIREVIDRAKENMGRKVYQYNLDGEFIKEYKSARDAASEIGSNHGNISRCCNGKIKHANGFIFKYDKVEKVEKITNPNAAKKKVIELDDQGNILNTWDSLMDCSRETGIDHGNLSRSCKNPHLKNKGRTFKFAEQNTNFAE